MVDPHYWGCSPQILSKHWLSLGTNIGFRLERKQARSNAIPEHSNSNLDVVPYLPPRQSSFPKKVNFTRYFRGEKSPSYPTLRQIAEYAPEVQNLLEPEFYWDVVSKVEEAGIAHCYDLTLPEGHAFITNGIVSHNTSFMLSAAVNMARLGARIAIFSMEMGIDQIVQRLVSMEAAINSQSLRLGQLTQQEWSRFVQVAGNMSNFRIFIDDTAALNPMQLRTKCLRMAREHGVDLVVVDYIQLMNSGGVYENNRVQEISYISRSMQLHQPLDEGTGPRTECTSALRRPAFACGRTAAGQAPAAF